MASVEFLQDFFERISETGSYDASDLRKLWSVLHKGRAEAHAELAKCLLLHIQASTKYKGDKEVPRCMQEWTSFMPQDGEKRAWAEEFVGKLLLQLSEWIPQRAKHSRERVLRVIVAVLRGYPHNAGLEENVVDYAVQQLRDHLADKDDGVRELVTVALAKLAAVEDGPVKDNVVHEELTQALHSDISQDVRTSIVKRLPLDGSTLCDILRHHRDKSAKVAAAVYDRVAQRVSLQPASRQGSVTCSLAQRMMLMWDGLNEPREEVRKAAQGLLAHWFTEDASGDVVRLLGAFGPQEHPDTCHLILDRLCALEKWDPKAWLEGASAGSRSPRALVTIARAAAGQAQRQAAGTSGSSGAATSWVSAISPDLAFVCVYACSQMEALASSKGRLAAAKVAAVVAQAEASEGAEAELVLENFLPAPQEMAELCLLAAEAGPPHRFVTAHLLALAALPCMNWIDACSRDAAEAALWRLITQVGRPDEQLPVAAEAGPGPVGPGCLPPASAGGDGSWEGAVLRFAAAVLGGGLHLVVGVLPMVLRLADQLGVSRERPEEASEGSLLQVLTYLHLLLVAAGPGVPPAAGCSRPTTDGEGAQGASTSLAEAVNCFARTTSGHVSPAVRAAAVRCNVVLCLRDGGLAHLPRAAAMLAPMLPAHRGADGISSLAGASASSGAHGQGRGQGPHNADDRDFVVRQQLPRRAALQGLIDLTLMWGEPTVSAELAAAVAAAAQGHRMEALRRQMKGLGMEGDDADGCGGAAAAAGGCTVDTSAGAAGDAAAPGVEPATLASQGVVATLLRLTEGVVRKLQGADAYTPARGCVADALLGMARLFQTWPIQRRLQSRLRHQVVTAMQPHHVEQLFTRLLLARLSPTVEAEPGLRAQLAVFFKSFQEVAASPTEEGALYRRMLATSFLHAARCAIALPAPPGAPTTTRGCAAPAMMEFAAELLAAAAESAARGPAGGNEEEDGEDVTSAQQQQQHVDAATGDAAAAEAPGGPAVNACVALCELVLEQVVRVALPGAGSLDPADPKVKAYAAELCKTPLRLLPGLPIHANAGSPAVMATVRRLAFLGRRALNAAEQDLLGSVVADTAFKKLQEFVRLLEKLQQENTAPLNEADAAPVIQALVEKLQLLPSLDEVHAAIEADEDWDALASDVGRGRGDQGAGTAGGRRGPGRPKGSTSAAERGGQGRRTGGQAASSSHATGRTRRAATLVDDDDDDDGTGNSSDDGGVAISGGSDADVQRGAGASARVKKETKVTNAPGRTAACAQQSASQDSTATASQGERRSSRAAAAKAAVKLQSMKARDVEAARLIS